MHLRCEFGHVRRHRSGVTADVKVSVEHTDTEATTAELKTLIYCFDIKHFRDLFPKVLRRDIIQLLLQIMAYKYAGLHIQQSHGTNTDG